MTSSLTDISSHEYVAKQRAPNEKIYNKKMADFKDWYNEEVY
ncbi:10237_t:CDS:2 [Funneliformis mosseae]|uniref:10237_t:CDS:1 n=1 Tax=Funneliformis mosseae TaxID=27381 RepID=A0A9N9F6E3_FUNMO|nr:10237_t:CDS:2 [Funneliformis mosseae]